MKGEKKNKMQREMQKEKGGERKKEIIIIGAGPAGIAASVQLSRYGVDCLLLEEGTPGGLLKNAHIIENYPGFPAGITGPQMVTRLREHLTKCNLNPLRETVKSLTFDSDTGLFKVTGEQEVFKCRTVVVASGTRPRQVEWVEALPEFLREHVTYEIYPITDLEGKNLLIVGAGDAAFDYALNLARRNTVTIANRGTRIKALPLLVERLKRSGKIDYLENASVRRIGRGARKPLSVGLAHEEGERRLEVDYIICAVGREPRMDFYSKELLTLREDLKKQEQLFEIGDVVNGIYRQAAIAAGNGVEAAMRICLRRPSGGAYAASARGRLPLDPRSARL